MAELAAFGDFDTQESIRLANDVLAANIDNLPFYNSVIDPQLHSSTNTGDMIATQIATSERTDAEDVPPQEASEIASEQSALMSTFPLGPPEPGISVPKTRASFDPPKRQMVAEVRKMGACYRCRLLKKKACRLCM